MDVHKHFCILNHRKKNESRAQWVDSSKAYNKSGAFDWIFTKRFTLPTPQRKCTMLLQQPQKLALILAAIKPDMLR